MSGSECCSTFALARGNKIQPSIPKSHGVLPKTLLGLPTVRPSNLVISLSRILYHHEVLLVLLDTLSLLTI